MDDWLEKTANGRMSHDDTMVRPYRSFLHLARQYFADIMKAQTALHHLHDVFSAGQDVRQGHCDLVISSLANFREPVLLFCSLLKKACSYPDAPPLNHFALIIALCQVNEQSYQLRLLINAYRPRCHSNTRPVLQRKHEIKRKLKKIEQNVDVLLQQISNLIEEASFLEGQLPSPPHTEHHNAHVPHQEENVIVSRCHPTTSRSCSYFQRNTLSL